MEDVGVGLSVYGRTQSIGAKGCAPESNASEIVVDFQWHFQMDCQQHFSLDVQWHCPMVAHLFSGIVQGLSFVQFKSSNPTLSIYI